MMAAEQATDMLVDRLVGELRAVRPGAISTRLAVGALSGTAFSLALLVLVLGARPDLTAVAHSPRFWSKAGFIAATAGLSLFVVARLARPDANPKIARIVLLPWIAYLPVALLELVHTRPADWTSLLLGIGWQLCTVLVLILSVPIHLGLWWASRSFAPTELAASATNTGLCASAIAAVVYCLHCPTDTAVFALVWYTLAFAIAAIIGRAAGTRLLHW